MVRRSRIFSIEKSCRRRQRRSSRQASGTIVLLAVGSPMLKSAVCGSVVESINMWLTASEGGSLSVG
ncbi:unnamed protein product [Prunus armeniaca]